MKILTIDFLLSKPQSERQTFSENFRTCKLTHISYLTFILETSIDNGYSVPYFTIKFHAPVKRSMKFNKQAPNYFFIQ